MGSSLSCFKKPRDGAVRAMPERRPVSASELQRPTSSFTASASLTLEAKRRQSVEVLHPVPKPLPSVAVEHVQKLVPAEEPSSDMPVAEPAVVDEVKDEVKAVVHNAEDMPVAGSTDDVGATDGATGMSPVSEGRSGGASSSGAQTPSRGTETGSVDWSMEGEGASKISVASKGPSLESVAMGGEEKQAERLADAVRPGAVGRKERKERKKELMRSDTLMDVRSSLPVRTHVTNYEKIEAAARVDPEEMVKSGKNKLEVASG